MEKIRLDWMDTARGLIVIWVVFYQCTTRTGYYFEADTVAYWLAEFGRPLRMPALFFFSGLLVASSLQKEWRDFINSKVIHLIFFFILWTIIVVLLRFGAQPKLILNELMLSLTSRPQSSLWFIAVLPAFLLIARLCRDVPPPIMLTIGLLLELAQIGPYAIWTDNTARYFIYFLLGIYGASSVYRISGYFEGNTPAAVGTILVFIAVNLVFVLTGLWQKVGLGFLLSCFAIFFVIALAVLMQKSGKFGFLTFAGKNSLVIYLGYAPFLIISAILLQKIAIFQNFTTLAFASFFVSITCAFALWFIVRKTPLSFLFERPTWLKI